MRHLLDSPPSAYGHPRNSRTLALLTAHVEGWRVRTQEGVWQVLVRIELRYKMACEQMSSPAPTYWEKLACMEQYLAEVRAWPDEVILLYDEPDGKVVALAGASHLASHSLGGDWEGLKKQSPLPIRATILS